MNKKKWISIFIVVILVAGVTVAINTQRRGPRAVSTFLECIAKGYPVMESYPRRCQYGSQTFTEDIGNALEKTDLIQATYPTPNQKISSPLTITGQAVGGWYFEASFPVKLFDTNNDLLAEGVAGAEGDWMTTSFVPFTVTLTFTPQPANSAGTLILYKDNPSGDPQNDDQLTVPVTF
jgi:hypothetical protein